jgi:glycosyltransferase involved in cell wall biosynthesis
VKKPGGVFLGYLHPNDLSASFHRSFMDLVLYDKMNPELNRLVSWGGVRAAATGLPEARNTIAKAMLESDAEWLLFVDADMGFDAWVLEQLLLVADENDLKLVGGLAFAYREIMMDGMNGFRCRPLPTIYDYGKDPVSGVEDFRGRAHYPVNQLVRVAATGCALVLIHRDVLQAVQDEYGETWFHRLAGPTGLRGEDISFFVKTGALGFEAYVHTGIRTTHHKDKWVSETDFWEEMIAPPATERVDVIVPTVKARLHNIQPLAESLIATTGLARLLFVVDDQEHAEQVMEFGETTVRSGSFARKINHAYPLTRAPWVQVVGDDCRFQPGWLDHQQLTAKLYKAKVVGSNDLANPRVLRGEHATHWMVSREYIDEVGASWDGPGVFAHEGYRHWFVDDEIVLAAKQRGVFQSALGARIEHLHPITGRVETDKVYERNDKYAQQDHDLFQKRVKANS